MRSTTKKNFAKAATDGRHSPSGLNGEAWVWIFLRVVLSTIVDFDEADEIVRAVQQSR